MRVTSVALRHAPTPPPPCTRRPCACWLRWASCLSCWRAQPLARPSHTRKARRPRAASCRTSAQLARRACAAPVLCYATTHLCPDRRRCAGAGRARVVRDFAERFAESADQLSATLQARLELQLLACATCASQQATAAVHALAASNGSSAWRWDAATFAEFQAFGAQLMALSHASTLSWDVLLAGPAQRAAYEAEAAAAAAAGELDATLTRRLAGGLSESLNTTAVAPAALASHYLPIWDYLPATGRIFVNFDTLSVGSTPERREACDTAVATGAPAATDLLRGTLIAGGVYAPASVIFAPALAPGAPPGTQPFGMCMLAFEWAGLLADSLPEYARDITAVITSASGRQATLQLSGTGVTALEPGGDLHDRSLDAWVQTSSMQLGGEAWGLALYPMSGPMDGNSLREPERNAGVIVACVTACALLFAFYELHVQRRSGVLIAALAANLKEVVAMQAEVERAAAQEASAQQRLLADGNRQKDEFVSMVSHEARNAACVLALQRRDR
jgi:hypothetical protein